MPIDYKEYHTHWFYISWLIRYVRAKNKCEQCMVQNHSFIIRDKENWHYAIHTHEVKEWHSLGYTNKDIAKEYDCTFIVLTTAHLDHNKNNNHFSNLSALCQKCHLKHDLKHHIQNRKYGRKHKLNQTKLEL